MGSGIEKCPRWAAAMLCALAASCAINDPLALDRAGSPRSLASIELVASEDSGEMQSAFRNAVITEFERRGIAISEGAEAVVDLSISFRSAEIAILPGEDGKMGEGSYNLRSDAREGRWFENCDAARLRATLAVFDRSSGSLDYRASAQSDHCEGENLPITQLAELLVADVMGEAPLSATE